MKYQKHIAELEERRRKIYEMHEDGTYSKEEFKERKGEVENQIMIANISLSEARIEQFDIESVLVYANNYISDLGRQWRDLSSSHSRFQKMVFPEGISYNIKSGFGTTKLGLIYELNRDFENGKSPLVHYLRASWNQLIAELKQWHELQQTLG